MIIRSMPLKVEEKEEIHTDDDDDVLLPAIAQVPHKTRKKDNFLPLLCSFF
jgi:hypothetical protein